MNRFVIQPDRLQIKWRNHSSNRRQWWKVSTFFRKIALGLVLIWKFKQETRIFTIISLHYEMIEALNFVWISKDSVLLNLDFALYWITSCARRWWCWIKASTPWPEEISTVLPSSCSWTRDTSKLTLILLHGRLGKIFLNDSIDLFKQSITQASWTASQYLSLIALPRWHQVSAQVDSQRHWQSQASKYR